MANQIKYQVKFDVQQSSLNQLKTSLQEIKKINLNDIMKINNTDLNAASTALRQVQQDAEKVENALSKAFNAKLNTFNIQTFNKELASSNLTIAKVQQSFSRAGTAGQSAFNNLAAQVLNTNVQLRQSNKLLDSMATSMANTIKWGITSSIFNNMTRSIQSAYYYAKDLDQSLTDIRIVTGDSADQMERFAQTANSAAKDLGRSTLDYTKAALTFYQQGLNDDEVQARTEATLKAENITGIGAEMADYLTAVWNGFKVGAEDAESYVDKLAAVADTTASDMGQLATAISKVASAANSVGVDIDQLNGQIATVIATTRQAPESVGVAFKTIYARINDIKAGTDEAEISLGNYSSKMAQLGFNVLDSSGNLRDTGEIIEEIGGSWEKLTREQQIYLAQTMAGQRQYNNLIALFDNWDQYLQSVNTSMAAQGTLNEKNDRYLESLEAHMQQLGTEAERTYDILFDENTVKGFVDSLSGALNIFNNFIKGIGGGTNAFVYFGSLIAGIFNKQIAQAIQGVGAEINRFKANLGSIAAKQDIINQIKSGLQVAWAGEGKNLGNEALTAQAVAAQKTLAVQKGLTAEQQKQAVEIQKQIGLQTQKTQDLQQKLDKEREENQLARDRLGLDAQAKTLSDQQKQDLQNKLTYYKQIQSESKNILSIFTQTEIAIKDENANAERRTQLAIEFKSHQKEIQQEYRKSHGSLQGFNELWQQTLQGIIKGKDYLEAFNKIQDLIRGQANDTGEIIQHINNLLTNQTDKTEQQLQESKEVTKEYQRQNGVLAQQGKHTINIQRMVRGLSSAGQVLSAWAGAAKTFGDQMATVQDKVNATFSGIQGTISGIGMMFGPIGMGVATLTNGVISFAKELPIFKNWLEDIEEHFKTTKQRVDQLNESTKKTNEISTNYANDKKSIQGIADEFQTLSAKAGQYNQNISSMSQEEQSRYRELVQQIVSKNPELIAGYNAQGEAIIANNNAIKDTLEYLDKQYQKEMAILYAKQNVATAEQVLKDSQTAATEATGRQATFNVDTQKENAQSSQVEKARGLTAFKELVTTEWKGETLQSYQDSSLKKLSDALHSLANSPDFESIYQDFQKYINEYNQVVNKTSDLNQIEQARQTLYANISSLQEETINIDWQSLIKTWWGEGILSKDEASTIQTGLVNFLNNIGQLKYGLTEAEQEVERTAAEINGNAESTSQELQSALTSYKNYLLGALRYDPSYNTQFSIIRDQWGENFTPQIESLFGSIMEDWVGTALEVDYDKYISEQDMTAAIVKDFNFFIDSIFSQINPEDLTNVNSEITELMSKSEELTAKEFEDQFKKIIAKFISSDSFQQIAKQDIEKNGNLNLTNILLQSIFGDNVKVAETQGKIYGIYNNAFKRITNNLNELHRDYARQQLEAAGYSQAQLNMLASKIQEEGAYFKDWFSLLTYAKRFFQQTGDDIAQGGNKLSEGFDKVNKAINKIQSGKDLTYKDKLNLMEYLGLDEQQVQDTETILNAFKEQIKGLEGLERYEGLSKIFTDFETLDKYKDEFGVTEEQQTSLLQDIIDKELDILGEDMTSLEVWAKQRGIILDGSVQKTREAVEALKITRSLDELGTLAQTAKKGGKESEDAIFQLQVKLKQLTGNDYTAAQITGMLDAIATAAQDDGVQIQNVLDLMNQLENYSPEDMPAADRYKQGRSDLDNLKGASKSLTDGSQMSQDQSNALAQILATNEQLNVLAETQGINSKAFLETLNEVISAKQYQLELSREQALQENAQKINEKQAQLDAEKDVEKRKTLQGELIALVQERAELLHQIAETKIDEDVDPQAMAALSEGFQKLATQSEELSDDLAENQEAADNLAEAVLRFDNACQSVAKSYNDWMDALQSGSIQQQIQAMEELRQTYADLLDLDGDSLSEDFLSSTENLDLMKAAIDGDIDAYDQLMNLAQQDIAAQIHLDTDKFQSDFDELMNLYYQGQSLDDLEVGASLNDEGFLEGLSNMVTAAGMTRDQATDYLASMGVDAEVVEQKNEGTETKQQTGWNSTLVPNEEIGEVPVIQGTGLGVSVQSIPVRYVTYSSEYTPTTETVTDSKENSAFSLKVISANKSSGGGFKFKQASNGGGSKGNARRSSGGGKGRGGGGGKGRSPKKGGGSRKSSKSNGKQLLDNLNKQQKFLDKQVETLRRKQKLQEQDLANQKQKLRGLGVEVNEQGDIINYMDALGQKQDKVNSLIAEENALIQKRNKLKNKDKQDALDQLIEKKKKEVDAAKDDLDKTKDAIKDYDDLRNDMEDLIDDIEDLIDQQIEINIEKFNAKVEMTLELGQAEREWNEFRKNVLENKDFMIRTDFDDISTGLQQNVDDFYSYFDVHGSIGGIETLTQHLHDIQKEINDIDEKGQSAIYGKNKAKAMEDLQNNLDKLMDQMENIEKISEDIDKAYLDTIDDIEEHFSKQGQEYEYVNDLIQHDMDLLSLLYGDKNYAAMNNYYETLRKHNLDQLDSLKLQRDFWKEQMENALNQGDTKAAEKFRENYKDVIQDLNSLVKDSVETLRDQYSNVIEEIFDDLDKKVSNGHGTDYLSDQWDLMNKNADEYLDNINSAFAIQQTERKYQNAINDTKNIKNQQALKKLMDQQLDILKDKEKLTQYDVDRAEKLLQVEQARIALQDARAAKTTMRLKRDAQGNYSYEYAADEDAIGQAEANLAAAQNDLYNFDKDHYKSNLDDILSAWKDFQQEYKDIVLDTSLTEEERVEKIALLRDQYGEYINSKLSENKNIRGNLMDSAFEDYAKLYDNDVENYKNMTDAQKQILMQNLVPAWSSGIQQMADKIAGEDGLVGVCEQAFKDIAEASDSYQTNVDELSKVSGLNFDDLKQGRDEIIDAFKETIQKNQDLITTMGQEITSVQSLRDNVQSLKEKYDELAEAAKTALTQGHDALQEYRKAQLEVFSNPEMAEVLSHENSSNGQDQITESLDQEIENINTWQTINKGESIDYEPLKQNSTGKISSYIKSINSFVKSDIASLIKQIQAVPAGFLNLLTDFDNNNNNNIEQTVYIDANFPNVDDWQDIMDAFSGLENKAIQKTMQ